MRSIVLGLLLITGPAIACEPGKSCPKAGATAAEKAEFDKSYHGDHKPAKAGKTKSDKPAK